MILNVCAYKRLNETHMPIELVSLTRAQFCCRAVELAMSGRAMKYQCRWECFVKKILEANLDLDDT